MLWAGRLFRGPPPLSQSLERRIKRVVLHQQFFFRRLLDGPCESRVPCSRSSRSPASWEAYNLSMECLGKMSTQQQRSTTRDARKVGIDHRSVVLSSIRLPEPRRCLVATKEVTHRSQWLRSALGHRSLDHHPLIVLTERL